MSIVGDQFDECGPTSSDSDNWRSGGNAGEQAATTPNANGLSSDYEPEICGCTLSVRQHEDILSVWNKHGSDSAVDERIKYVHATKFFSNRLLRCSP